MSFDDWLLLIHIIAVAAWLGGGIMLSLLASRANKIGQGRNMIAQMEWVGPRIGGPVSLLIPITGVWMVLRNDSWEFTDLWIAIGIGLFVLLFLIGVGFHGPNYKKIHAIEEESGADAPMAQRLIQRGFAAARLEVVVLLVVVGLMVFKP